MDGLSRWASAQVPRWQSSSKHERLRKVMEDRPDLIKSELSVWLHPVSPAPSTPTLRWEPAVAMNRRTWVRTGEREGQGHSSLQSFVGLLSCRHSQMPLVFEALFIVCQQHHGPRKAPLGRVKTQKDGCGVDHGVSFLMHVGDRSGVVV